MPQPRPPKGFTLVEIMIVVAILSVITLIAIPSFFRARELSRKRACQENQAKIDGAKQQWALETSAPPDSSPTWTDLVGASLYIRKSPACPASGTYTINAVNEDPECSLANQDPYPHTFEANPPGST